MATPSASTRGKKGEKCEKSSPEITDDSCMAEVSKQLTQISRDLSELKNEIKKTVKCDKLESLVTTIVKKIVDQNNKEREEGLKAEFKKMCQELKIEFKAKTDKMDLEIEKLETRAEVLTEKLADSNKEIRELKQRLQISENISRDAFRLSNRNEQYSRKCNFKIMGVKETQQEDTLKVVKKFIQDKAGFQLNERDVIATHRIPGETGKPRPIIVKVLNSEIKAKVMKKRSEIKRMGNGLRLVDDVTKANSALISQLLGKEDIESAWYFNGSVFAKAKGKERKIKFDITDDLDTKIKKISK